MITALRFVVIDRADVLDKERRKMLTSLVVNSGLDEAIVLATSEEAPPWVVPEGVRFVTLLEKTRPREVALATTLQARPGFVGRARSAAQDGSMCPRVARPPRRESWRALKYNGTRFRFTLTNGEKKMTLRRSRGGHKAAQTRLKTKLESARRPRFPRLSVKQRTEILRHWIAANQVPPGFEVKEVPLP